LFGTSLLSIMVATLHHRQPAIFAGTTPKFPDRH
jgi:hypothetical protein